VNEEENMLRAFALSRGKSSCQKFSALSLQRMSVMSLQWRLQPVYYRQISWFSTAEIPTVILTAEDTKKMLVVDLKNELKKRGVSTTGKKAELLERLTELLEKEKQNRTEELTVRNEKDLPTEGPQDLNTAQQVESDIKEFSSTSEAHFTDELQKLDLAVKEMNHLLFEETMKRMETEIRSKRGYLSAEMKDSVAANLCAWNAMDGIPSESIASVLKSAGYIGLSVKNREVVEEIIEKYLKAKSKSTRSIAIFFTALNKVGMKWSDIKSEREKQILKLVNILIHAEDLDVRSYCELSFGLIPLGLNWVKFSAQLKRRYLERAEELKPIMQIGSLDILVKAFSYFLSPKVRVKRSRELERIIFDLSLEGLKQIVSQEVSEKPKHTEAIKKRFIYAVFIDGYPSIQWKDVENNVRQLMFNGLERTVPWSKGPYLSKLLRG
jgi:hypothetical protein